MLTGVSEGTSIVWYRFGEKDSGTRLGENDSGTRLGEND